MTMHKKQTLAVVLATALSLAVAFPAMAQTSTTTAPAAVTKAITKADKEISARLDALNKLSTRIQDIKNLSAADKSTLAAEIQSQTDTMNSLKAKIDADTDPTTLKTDLNSITIDYRIYALIIPQAQIIAAADRIKTTSLDLAIVASKLQARMTAAQAGGNDITALQAPLADIQTKLTDAQTQAQNAVSAVTALVPDQGDTTTATANQTALKNGRAALKVGQTDLQAARKDAGTILKGVRAFKVSNTASSTASTN